MNLLASLFSTNVAISLADDAFFFTTVARPVPIELPAYVAVSRDSGRVLAVGGQAKSMLSRTPDNIEVIRLLEGGVISHKEATESLLRFGITEVVAKGWFRAAPRVLVALRTIHNSAPSKCAIKESLTRAGAREVYLMDIDMASAIGMGLEVAKPELQAVLTISNDWFSFAVISLSGIVTQTSGAIGTDAFVEDIQNHLFLTRQFRPDAATLESQLLSSGLDPAALVELAGWEAWTGRVEQGKFTTQALGRNDFALGMAPSLVRLSERIKATIRRLPHDQQYQLQRSPIHATGSAMRIPGLAQTLSASLGLTVTPHRSNFPPSIEGAKQAIGEINYLRPVLKNNRS